MDVVAVAVVVVVVVAVAVVVVVAVVVTVVVEVVVVEVVVVVVRRAALHGESAGLSASRILHKCRPSSSYTMLPLRRCIHVFGQFKFSNATRLLCRTMGSEG